ncbi:neurexin-2-like [Stylophora pistillata]|uniref:neurexin-2-like n=1 Tax=Stylophora pistillata TaxID=50429 RepID=UPI000C054FC6|nr:neurexin-2-like [Stylophora pistillata]
MYLCVSLTIFGFFAQGIKGEISSENPSESAFLSYNGNTSRAVYEAWRISGELSFLFKTNRPTAFLAYQDDGARNFLDLFLVKGKLRAWVRFNNCTPKSKELTVNGNFSDSRWHRVRLTRGNEENVTLTVDGCKTEYISCKYTATESESWKALYVGNIPANISFNDLANPRIVYESIGFEFQGCIGHMTQTTPEHSPKPLVLLHSEWTGANCQSQCSSGRKCNPIDDVIRTECECPGY